MAGRFSVEAVFKAIDRISAPVTRMQNRVGKFARKMDESFRGINRRLDKFIGKVKRMGVVAAASFAVIGGAMANVVSTGAQFEQTLVNAAVKFPGQIRRGTEAFEELEAIARKTGSTTEFSASQSAEALNFLAMAGFNSEQAMAALPGVVDLATAAQIELSEASDVASDSLGAFNLMTADSVQLGKNLARVNDVIAQATSSANLSVQELFESMVDGGPVATTAGASIETFAALAGELANAATKGSRAGITLKNVFLRLQAPTAKGARLLSRLGIVTKDADGNLRDVIDILGDLDKATKNLGTADKGAVLEGIFGKIPIAGVNILLNKGADGLKEMRAALEGAAGASAEAARVMRDTMMGRLKSLESAIEGVKISLFSMNNGPLAETIEGLTEWVRANEKLIAQEVGAFINMLIRGLQFLGRHWRTIAKLVKWVGILIITFKTFAAAMMIVNAAMLANPIGLIIAGVAVLTVAVAALIIWWEDFVEVFDKLPAGVKGAISAMAGPLGWLLGMPLMLIKNWGKASEFFRDLFDWLGKKLMTFLELAARLPGAVGSGARLAIEALNREDERGENQALGPLGSGVLAPQLQSTSITNTQISRQEVTIRDDTGRAQVSGDIFGEGFNFIQSGSFE